MMRAPAERGFALVETLLAGALFIVVAFAGFDVLQHIGAVAATLAQRTADAAQVSLAVAGLRADALAAVALWKPAATCGDALEVMLRDAGGTSFVLYAARDGALVRATAPGPLDPCDPALRLRLLVAPIAGLHVTPIGASELAAHADPFTGAADGAAFEPDGVAAIAVDAHARAGDGTIVTTGNAAIELVLDAGGMSTPVDLVAGNRPSSYTHVLAYTCAGRCEAGAPFPEIRGGSFSDCSIGYDFGATPAYYVPATYGFVALGAGKHRIVVTSYRVAGAYTFSFAGPAPLATERAWPVAVWPPPDSALAGTIADPYPVAYGSDAIAARGIAQVAADLGEPAAFATALVGCDHLHADPTFHG